MPTTNLSVVSALGALLEDARTGRLTATTAGDRWVLLRLEEALRDSGFIRQMATRDQPSEPMFAAPSTEPLSTEPLSTEPLSTEPVSIRAQLVRAAA